MDVMVVYAVFIALVVGMYFMVRWIGQLFHLETDRASLPFRFTIAERSVLEASLPYYRRLPNPQRRRFERRVKRFINDKDFHGRGLKVTQEMKVMIAGAAVQLTFGLEPLLLIHFRRILVYPDRYRNRTQANDHIGEVNPGMRVIAVSWKHFMEGFADPSNARNVGLHEMAHALWLENHVPNAETGFLPARLLQEWRHLAEEESIRIRAGEDRLFRAYAATDQAEFFAVAMEYFFEQPVAFQEKLPDLYSCMCRLLRQDPARLGLYGAG